MSRRRLAIEATQRDLAPRRRQPILRRRSLSVGTGEVHGLVGESGAGKSTIAKAILGIIPSQVRITGGDIDFEGTIFSRFRATRFRAVLGRDIALDPAGPV